MLQFDLNESELSMKKIFESNLIEINAFWVAI